MSLDTIKNPIEAENISAHEKELEQRIFKVQLFFLEKKLKEKTSEGRTYAGLLDEVTSIIEHLASRRRQFEIKTNPNLSDEEIKTLDDTKYHQEICDEINRISSEIDGEERVNAVYAYVQKSLEQYPAAAKNERSHVGLVEFEKESVGEGESFEIPGLVSDDELLEIHFNPAYIEGKNVRLQELKKWFSELAEIIVKKYPEARAIAGRSWLLSHPLMRRLGFTKINGIRIRQGGDSYWNQLITEDGQIDTEKLEFLELHGRLPLDVASGYILVEDFLARYLPDDKRGEIVLKRIDLTSVEQKRIITEQIEEGLRKNWDTAIEQQLPVNFLLEKIPDFVEVARSLGLEIELKNFIQTCIDRKYTMAMIKGDENLLSEFRPLISRIEAKIRGDVSYVDYKVVIPPK